MENSDLYSYDESHPIPDLEVIDVNGVRKDGGSDLVMIVASPLKADERSLRRLLRKIEVYLNFVQSEQFRAEAGTPAPENTRIIVKINRDSCHEAFDLLYKNRDWIHNNNVTLVVDPCFPEAGN